MWHAIEVNAGLHIVFQFSLQVATNITFEQIKAVMGRAGSVCLLNNQLPAFVEPLERTRNCECHEQPYQCEYGALDGREPCHVGDIFFLLQVSQAEVSPVVQQDE